MVYATKITLKTGCTNPTSTLEIATIYLTGLGNERFYPKEAVHDFVRKGNVVRVDIGPFYPKLIDAISSRGEKYVRSEPNDTPHDNLLRLPKV